MGASQNAVKIMFGFNPNSTTNVVFPFRDTSDGRKSETQISSLPLVQAGGLLKHRVQRIFTDSCRFVTDYARLRFRSTLMICRQRQQIRVASAIRRPVGMIRGQFHLLQDRVTCLTIRTSGMVGWLRIGTCACGQNGDRCNRKSHY